MLKPKIIFIGPIPPPFIGPNLATRTILNSKLKNEFALIHCDTSDHRDITTLGVIDFRNIYLSFKFYLLLLILIIKSWPRLVYIPINQNTIGYFRDAMFILISKLFNRKVICHLRGGNFRNWYDSASTPTKWFVRLIHSFIDGQIVLGEKLRHLFDGIVPDEKIFVVPNGKDIKLELKERSDPNRIKILFLSNFIPEKGILDVLNAVPFVFEKHPNAEFLFAGNWRDDKTKRRFEVFLEQNPNLPIELKGPVHGQSKYELFTAADIFVFPTYYPAEGHPWVIVEAMAAELPIITTDHGSISESVFDGVNGFMVEKKNPLQVADKIKILIENPSMRKRMGEESRRLYLDHFTEDKMIQKLGHAFNKVLAR